MIGRPALIPVLLALLALELVLAVTVSTPLNPSALLEIPLVEASQHASGRR
ncbi:MAG: hypothetical protein QXD04_01900 [Candidatus Bathyarchaeia archaeon]